MQLPLLVDAIILYMENSNGYTKNKNENQTNENIFELINEFSKVAEYNLNEKNQLNFYLNHQSVGN